MSAEVINPAETQERMARHLKSLIQQFAQETMLLNDEVDELLRGFLHQRFINLFLQLEKIHGMLYHILPFGMYNHLLVAHRQLQLAEIRFQRRVIAQGVSKYWDHRIRAQLSNLIYLTETVMYKISVLCEGRVKSG